MVLFDGVIRNEQGGTGNSVAVTVCNGKELLSCAELTGNAGRFDSGKVS